MFRSRSNWLAAFMLSMFLALAGCGGPSGSPNGGENGGPNGGGEAAGTSPTATRSGTDREEGGGYRLGEPRDDLNRFFGLYGDADNPGEGRGQFFVTEAKRPKYAEQSPEVPPGYLMMGAMWADVAPSYMKSLSNTTFEYVTMGDFAPPEPIVVEFEFGPDGNAVALTFKSGFDEFGRRQRLGDLPEEWR